MGVDAFILPRLILRRTNILSRNKNITFCLMLSQPRSQVDAKQEKMTSFSLVLRKCDKTAIKTCTHTSHIHDFMLTLIYRYGCIIKFSIFFLCLKKTFFRSSFLVQTGPLPDF